MGDTELPGKNMYSNRYTETTRPVDCAFWRMILVWQGSVFKLIWIDVLVYLTVYGLLSILYRTVFMRSEIERELFELLCIYASKFNKIIPVTFITGFYVTNVVSRYWDQFMSLPWPDRIAYKLVAYLPGQDDYHRMLRRTVMRYVNLSTLLVFRLVSRKARTRFQCYTSLIESGLVLPEEATRLATIDQMTPHETTWAPIMWVHDLLARERDAGHIKLEPPIYGSLIASFEYIESSNRKIFNHGWVNFPLAYTQVVTLSVYAYLFSSLFSQQYLEPSANAKTEQIFPNLNISFTSQGAFSSHTPVMYFPFFGLFEFIAYLGWVKIAETLLNPWGDDDEDFQINYLIDRNFQTSMLIVDEAISQFELKPDPFMFSKTPFQLPYVLDSKTEHDSELRNQNENNVKEKLKDAVHRLSSYDDSELRRRSSGVQIIDKSNGNQLRKMSHIMKPLVNFGHLVIDSAESPKILGQRINFLVESPNISGHLNDRSSEHYDDHAENPSNSFEQNRSKIKMSELRSPNEFRRFLNP